MDVAGPSDAPTSEEPEQADMTPEGPSAPVASPGPRRRRARAPPVGDPFIALARSHALLEIRVEKLEQLCATLRGKVYRELAQLRAELEDPDEPDEDEPAPPVRLAARGNGARAWS